MRRPRTLPAFVLLTALVPWFSIGAGQAAPMGAVTSQRSVVGSSATVDVPHPETTLSVDGRTVEGEGTRRTFALDPAPQGTAGRVTLTATWPLNAYSVKIRRRTVTFVAGQPVAVDLRAEDPGDRVRVDYVPTSPEAVGAMVAAAALTASDVVFEPGCGDARITIAAVTAGARRGVGIDIDEERVVESRVNVKAAGLEDRIDIRLGDALEIPDLALADVVFLYMGDEFNRLMRPRLWRELKVGARVISYRFGMGDWAPDRTVQVGGRPGWDTQIHVWTITPALKSAAGLP